MFYNITNQELKYNIILPNGVKAAQLARRPDPCGRAFLRFLPDRVRF